ncbi:related to hydrolases of the alpha/beta superfamily [Ramularia collo-cygni]|uniref:Related to hydrolases of the alpha/beta superfamily n=1 Tax=Ramularia collo-cygni TaxID=112498 RepID=A0A2D3UX97_9PEZI|nr:related to hydrolases of the alpha/beta superfamily [Ramularia collo-cygni]CZT14734.1 related to hydrolases of the alpha/beta superfamily [Ramularia collo-cygni]
MTHGIAGLKEQFLPTFAEAFQAAGYSVLLYDHRNWGASEGNPRNETDPIQQARDYSDAFDFAASLPEVDDTKIVYWGSSMSGGAVIHAAALDHRIAAVISQVPFVSGENLAVGLAPRAESLYAARRQVKAGNPPPLIKLFADDPTIATSGDHNAMVQDPSLVAFLEALKAGNIPWSPFVTPQTLLNLAAFEPLAFVHRIAPTPLLMVVVGNDDSSPTVSQLKAFATAYEPKTLVLLRNTGHFDPYHGTGYEDNIKAQLKFLGETL